MLRRPSDGNCEDPIVRRLVIVCTLLCGCGAVTTRTVIERPGSRTVIEQPATATAPTFRGPDSYCALYLEGHDATFSIAGIAAVPICQDFVQKEARAGQLWTETPQPNAGGGEVCRLVSPQGNTIITVKDDGGQVFGQQVCEVWIASGYKELGAGGE